MPGSGAVYQPTTVSYEQQGPSGYLSQTVSQGLRGARCTQWLLLILGLFSLAAGLIMVIEGAVDIGNKHQHEVDSSNSNLPEGESTDLVILIIGAILMLIGLLMLSYYVRAERRRKNCPCFPSKEQRMARQLRENQAGNGQILTLNPSTDLLVTAQYAPVSEVAYQPPNLVADEEERRKLMGSDNKDCVLGRCSSMGKASGYRNFRRQRKISMTNFRRPPSVGSGPSIAPLACGEEITPSLRSSFASIYYNMTPYDSKLSLDEENSSSVCSDML